MARGSRIGCKPVDFRKRVPHEIGITNEFLPRSGMNDLQTDRNVSLRKTFRTAIGSEMTFSIVQNSLIAGDRQAGVPVS